jgi:hypothetical protein
VWFTVKQFVVVAPIIAVATVCLYYFAFWGFVSLIITRGFRRYG